MLKPTNLVIGYREQNLVVDAHLSSSGVNTESERFLVPILVAEEEDTKEAWKIAEDQAGAYEYIEVKTVNVIKAD
jgi:hypothetical protein